MLPERPAIGPWGLDQTPRRRRHRGLPQGILRHAAHRGSQLNYYGCQTPVQVTTAVQSFSFLNVLMGLVLALGAGLSILIAIGVLAFLFDRNWLSGD